MSNKKAEFCVLSNGDCGWYCHGETPTLLGAKRLATKSQYYEGFDWHTPIIMRIEDTVEYHHHGYGWHRAPKDFELNGKDYWYYCDDDGWEQVIW